MRAPRRNEDRVVLAPHDERRRLAGARILPARIGVEVRGHPGRLRTWIRRSSGVAGVRCRAPTRRGSSPSSRRGRRGGIAGREWRRRSPPWPRPPHGLRPVIVRAPEKRPPIVGDTLSIAFAFCTTSPRTRSGCASATEKSNGRAEVLHVEHVAINVKHVGEAGDVLGEEMNVNVISRGFGCSLKPDPRISAPRHGSGLTGAGSARDQRGEDDG